MGKATLEARQAALFARATDQVLATSLRTLDKAESSPERNLTRSWIITELERRYPDASDAVEAAFEAAELKVTNGPDEDVEDVDYTAVLLGAIPGIR